MNLESIYDGLKVFFKSALELSALFLGVVNALMLLKLNLRDKPKLNLEPIHPEVYQWWFKLPAREVEGHQTRGYGFIVYVGISNRGLRKVSLTSWRLVIGGQTYQTRKHELKPINMPEITFPIGPVIKMLPSLGQKTLMFEGDTSVDSGGSISGTAYYIYECWGDEIWDPAIKGGKINGRFIVTDAFGKNTSCKVVFSERPLEKIQAIAPGIEEVR